MNSLLKNGFFVLLNRFVNIIFPLIIYAYAARILGVDQNGTYYYYKSIVSYYVLFAGLGISSYAIREGVPKRDDSQGIKKFTSEIFTINVFATLIAYMALVILLLTGVVDEKGTLIIFILSFEIVFATLGMEWIFQIYERFDLVVVRNIIIKIVSLLLLFILVKEENDLNYFAIVMVLGNCGSGIFNFIYAKRKTRFNLTLNKYLFDHFKPIVLLFALTVTTDIYTNSDVTMIGILSNNREVGLYTAATKIYTVCDSIFASIIIASFPRIVDLINSKFDEAMKIAKMVINVLFLILLPSVLGILMLSTEMIGFLSGLEYIKGAPALQILSIALIFHCLNWYVTRFYTLPYKKDKMMLTVTSLSAVLNVALNLFFISAWGCVGAAITTVISEALPCVIYFRSSVFKLSLLDKNHIIKILIGLALEAIVIVTLKQFLIGNYLLLVSIVLSGIIYFAWMLITKNPYLIQLVNIFREARLKK